MLDVVKEKWCKLRRSVKTEVSKPVAKYRIIGTIISWKIEWVNIHGIIGSF